MGFLRALLLTTLISCKTTYVIEQGIGQLRLQNRAKQNADVLNDPRFSEEQKRKIKLVQKYKAYFYKYFKREETEIYSKTTMLEQEAVTYLVIASRFDEIKAHNECFPIMGCFPYMGFFKKESAQDYARKMQEKGFVTFTRPVYAYSTLGYFQDSILSSFFYYDDFGLAELIFHELFHTIFFMKNDVQLNENLANFFGKELALEYFQFSDEQKDKLEKKIDDSATLAQLAVNQFQSINKKFEQMRKSKATRMQFDQTWDRFIKDEFKPSISLKCKSLGIKPLSCSLLNRKWNQASAAAYLTYEKKRNFFKTRFIEKKTSLKNYLIYLEKEYENFQKTDKKVDFVEYLKRRK